MNKKFTQWIFGLLMVSGWVSLTLSIVFYLFFWRVDNEPGAKDMPELLWAAIFFLVTGGLSFLSGNIGYLVHKVRKAYIISWVICAVLGTASICLSPLLLVFMV